MPFLRKIENPYGTVGIWNITETGDELAGRISLYPDEAVEFSEIRHERRKKEFLTIRLLLSELLGRQLRPEYGEDGRPFLNEFSLKISIAHSTDYAVVFLSEHNVGIDIENTNRPVRSIAGKFMSERELNNVSGFADPEYGMLVHWCAKEAVFKCTCQNGIDFRSQIHVSPFVPSDGCEFSAGLQSGNMVEEFFLQHLKIGNNALVWCVEVHNNK